MMLNFQTRGEPTWLPRNRGNRGKNLLNNVDQRRSVVVAVGRRHSCHHDVCHLRLSNQVDLERF